MTSRHSRLRLAAWTCVSLVCLSILFGFFGVPPILRRQLERRLGVALNRVVTVREVSFNPFTLTATLRGLEVKERGTDTRFLALDEARVNLELSSLYYRAPVIGELTLVKPYVGLRRRSDQSYNVSDIAASFSKPAAPGQEPLRYSVHNIRIVDGSVDFADEPVGLTHTVRAIELSVPFVSNLPVHVQTFVEPSFRATVNGRVFELEGGTKPFSEDLTTAVQLKASDVDVPFYLKYSPVPLPFEVPRGRLDVALKFSFRQPKGAPPSVTISGAIDLRAFAVAEPGKEPLLALDAVHADLASFVLPQRELRLSLLRVSGPAAQIERDARGALNVLRLSGTPAPAAPAAPATTAAPASTFTVDIDRFEIVNGRVQFSDRAVRPAFSADVTAIELGVNAFSTRSGKSAALTLAARTDAGETVALDGVLAVEPLLAEGTLNVKGVPLPRYAPYYRDAVFFDIVKGAADVTLRYHVAAPAKGGGHRVSLDAATSALELRKRGETTSFLAAKDLALKRLDVDLDARSAVIGEVTSSGGALALRWPKDGAINVLELIPPGPPPAPGTEWSWRIERCALSGYAFSFVDETAPRAASLLGTGLSLTAAGLTSVRDRQGSVEFRMRPKDGDLVSGKGKIGVEPAKGSLALELRRVPLGPFEAYMADKMDAALNGGTVAGTLNYGWEPAPDGSRRHVYGGNLTFADLDLVSNADAGELLRFGTLYLGGMEGGLNPEFFRAKEIAASDFYAHLSLDGDATLNLRRAFAPGAAAPAEAVDASAPVASPATPPAPASSIVVDAATLQGGTIDFEDHFIKPNYSAHLTELAGRFSGLSTIENRPADVELAAKLGGYAPLSITGKLQPFGAGRFADLRSQFSNMDLSPLTPYAGKYLGYKIEKGSLTWDLTYHVLGQKLTAQHKILLNQLTLGEKVESPDATHLPIRLAISLLKDREGRIDLDLPVTGSLDDPKFKVWPIVMQIVKNLLVKIATSPFALFGHMFGGKGEELAYLEFEPGYASPGAAGQAKLDALAKVLSERPSVLLEVGAVWDVERDRAGLVNRFYERKLKAQKLKQLEKGAASPSLDEVVIEPAERDALLLRAYKQEKFPKPRNAIGIAKSLPPSEMESLIRTHITIGDDDLRQLAMERATAVKDALLKRGAEPDRVLLVDSKVSEPNSKLPATRVDFVIK